MMPACHLCASVLLIALATATVSSQGQEPVSEFDPGFTFSFDLTRRLRFDVFTGREKSEELHSAKQKVGAGFSFRVKPLFRSFLDHIDTDKKHVLTVAVAYEYSRASENNILSSIENKLMVDAIGRWEFPGKLLASDRNRVEFRWIDGDYSTRYRNRAMLERPFKVSKKITITPYGAAEAFWDARHDRWSKFEFTGGVQVPLFKRTSLDGYYSRAHCVTCADAHTNIYGLAFNIFLPFKQK